MLIPLETNREHLNWRDLRCDTLALLNLIAREGRRYGDFNTCVSLNGTAWNLHWPEGPLLNHYDWIWTGRRTRILRREIRRPMTNAELHRDVDQWADAQISRWRRAARGGPKPATVRRRQRQAKRRGVIICWELKSHHFDEPDVAERLVEDVTSSGWPGFFMTLVTMRSWGPKLRAVKRAGGQTALLAHGAPRPTDLDLWHPAYIDRIWGRFANGEKD